MCWFLGSGLCFLTSLPEDADPRGPTLDLDLSMPERHLRDVQTLPSGLITTSQAAPRVGWNGSGWEAALRRG